MFGLSKKDKCPQGTYAVPNAGRGEEVEENPVCTSCGHIYKFGGETVKIINEWGSEESEDYCSRCIPLWEIRKDKRINEKNISAPRSYSFDIESKYYKEFEVDIKGKIIK